MYRDSIQLSRTSYLLQEENDHCTGLRFDLVSSTDLLSHQKRRKFAGLNAQTVGIFGPLYAQVLIRYSKCVTRKRSIHEKVLPLE